eukprot:m51a1_g2728 hypothetical protein (408) ;mRNA; r:872931-877071
MANKFLSDLKGSKLALRVVAHKAITAILKTYKNKQGKVCHQLNLHLLLHLSFFVEKIRPALLFDMKRAENAQAKVTEISKQTSYKMQQYALHNASCFQLLFIHFMIEDVGSKDYELFHRAAGDAAHMYRTTVHQVDMKVKDKGEKKKIKCLWVLDGIPLQQRTVPLGKIKFFKVHCYPIVLPQFRDIVAKLSNKVHHQLNLHSLLHLSFFVEKIGPALLFDMKRAENAQAKVTEISKQTSYKMQQYALHNASCFQLLFIHSMVEDVVGSKDYKLFHRAAGDAAHMYRTTVHQVDMKVKDKVAKVSPLAHLFDFDCGFYEYCEVWGIDTKNGLVLTKPLVQPPGGPLCQSPFEWARPQSHADQPLGKIEFFKVHCCPIVLPQFRDIVAKLSNKVSVVIPIRFLITNLW